MVDDDPSIRGALTSLIRSVGLHAEAFGSAREFLTRQPADAPSCLVLDMRLPGLSGLGLQRELAAAQISLPIISITGHGDIRRKAVASGAAVDLTGWNTDKAVNAFANTTVSSIVLEGPDGAFGATTIGFWGVTALATDAGGWRQINRAGQPMIQPIFNPDDCARPRRGATRSVRPPSR